MIPDDVVERVRASADIVQLIGESVQLKRTGSDFRGPCPFHNGKGPNFSVSPKRNSYHCFVCHESGDVFTYVRKRFGLDWPSAVKYVGERFGIEVVDIPTRSQERDPNERSWEILSAAAAWFEEQLEESDAAAEARRYLEERGLDATARKRFGIGYAPPGRDSLTTWLGALGYTAPDLIEAGLLIADGDSEALPRVRFRDRITFPIKDEVGHHVGFGARATGAREPKYLNSPESNVFQKRRILYGLHDARNAMRRARRAIVVEGYMDVIRLVLAGVEEVVAPLGTALTDEQAGLLVRYSKSVHLLYDSDDAGLKATFRSGRELLMHKAEVRVVTLPPGRDTKDPDSFVRSYGIEALESCISDSIDLLDRQIQLIERRGWLGDVKGRRMAIDRLIPTVRAAADPLMRDLYLTRLSEVTRVDKETLAAEVDRTPPGALPGQWQPSEGSRRSQYRQRRRDVGGIAPGDRANNDSFARGHAGAGKRRPGRGGDPGWWTNYTPPRVLHDEPVERAVIRLMLADHSAVERFAERFHPEELRDPEYRAIFQALLAGGHDDDPEVIISRMPAAAAALYQEMLADGPASPEGVDPELTFARLSARPIEERIVEIRDAIGAASTKEEQDALSRERMELERELRAVLPVRNIRKRDQRR